MGDAFNVKRVGSTRDMLDQLFSLVVVKTNMGRAKEEFERSGGAPWATKEDGLIIQGDDGLAWMGPMIQIIKDFHLPAPGRLGVGGPAPAPAFQSTGKAGAGQVEPIADFSPIMKAPRGRQRDANGRLALRFSLINRLGKRGKSLESDGI